MLTLWIRFYDDPEGTYLIVKDNEFRSRVHLKRFLKKEFNSTNCTKFERKVFGSKSDVFSASDQNKKFKKLKLGDKECEFAWVIMTKQEVERVGLNV